MPVIGSIKTDSFKKISDDKKGKSDMNVKYTRVGLYMYMLGFVD